MSTTLADHDRGMGMKRTVSTLSVVCMLTTGVVLGVLSLTSQEAKASTWSTEIVDSAGNPGIGSSIVVDGSGYPRIGYKGGDVLKYAKWNGSAWQIEIVDSSAFVGVTPSVSLDGNDYPHIGYHDETNQDLKYTKWNGSSWETETVDSAGDVGTWSSLALDVKDYAHIAYYDWTNGDLKYASWNGSAWGIQVVDSAGDVGRDISLALDRNDYAHISYDDAVNFDLKYAWWNGTAWDIQTVDSTGNVGFYTSIRIDDHGYPHISYWDGTNRDLKYARWNGTAWIIQVVDSAGDQGSFTSLALDDNDYPHIGYADWTNFHLKYARWNGTAWVIETVDTTIGVGRFCSMTLDRDNSAHMSYYDSINNNLRYARLVNSPPNIPSTPFGPASGIVGSLYTYSTMATDPDGNQVKYSFDWDDGNMSQTGFVDSGISDNSSHSWTIPGTYRVKAKATDSIGASSGWSNSLSVTVTAVPDSPIGLTAYPRDGFIVLSWSPPVNDGGSPITNYTVYRGMTPGSETPLITIGNVTTYTDTGLLNGQTYCYQVTANNSVGEGLRSNEACATPATIPGPPTGLTATAGDAQVTLAWSAPADDGGSPIINYTIHRGMAPGTETFLIETGNILIFTDTGLTNGQTYYYTVAAKNAISEGPKSEEANATPMTVPGAPTGLLATAGDGQASLSWNAAASDGGSAITNYSIYRGLISGGESLLVTIGNLTNHIDVGLTNGQTYYYEVSAINSVGEGPSSMEASVTPATFPSEPLNLQATAGDRQTVLAWAAPGPMAAPR